jgi:copper(I)-binding protein
MKRALVLVAATSLSACSYLGIGGSEDKAAVLAPPAADAPTTAAADPTAPQQGEQMAEATAPAEPSGVALSIKPPMPQSTLAIADTWAMVTPKGTKVAAGYLTVANGGTETDRLVSASTPRAARTELHEVTLDGAVAKMRPTQAIDVAAGGSVTLKHNGYHVMFMDVDTPFVEGETIPVMLTFEKAGTIEVTMRVKRGANIVAHQN